MTAREQLIHVCQRNGDLACENQRLTAALERSERECRELSEANANLRVERDAADVLMGSAMDKLLGGTS